MMQTALSFETLFAWVDEETARWQQWFEQNPAALDTKIDVADVGDARGLLHHMFWVEQLYVARLLKEPRPAGDQIPRQPTQALFDYGKNARARLRAIVAGKDDAALDQMIAFETLTLGNVTASVRKCVIHALIHGIRHWAQLATALRKAGYKQPWSHDFLNTQVMK